MAIPNSGQVGPQFAQDGSIIPQRLGKLGEQIASELQPRYYEAAYRNQMYMASVPAAAAITAFVGAAGGTPQIAVWNPAGSGKNIVIVSAAFANLVAASAAGTVAWALYFGPTAAITQATVSVPTNLGTQVASGSVATAFKNVALTSSTAAANVIPLQSYYWATAAGAAIVANGEFDIAGKVIIPPGSYAALGGSSALTSATWIGSLVWAESPV